MSPLICSHPCSVFLNETNHCFLKEIICLPIFVFQKDRMAVLEVDPVEYLLAHKELQYRHHIRIVLVEKEREA